MLFCKVCSLELTSDRRTRLKLKGNAVGINNVCSELFDSLMKKYADHPFSSFHSYLSDEPAFVCKSCFSVSITRTVTGDTHTIIEGSLPARSSLARQRPGAGARDYARRWSKTVGRRAKQYDFTKPASSATNTSRPLTKSSIAFCCWCFKLSKPNACTAASIAASICSLLYLTMST